MTTPYVSLARWEGETAKLPDGRELWVESRAFSVFASGIDTRTVFARAATREEAIESVERAAGLPEIARLRTKNKALADERDAMGKRHRETVKELNAASDRNVAALARVAALEAERDAARMALREYADPHEHDEVPRVFTTGQIWCLSQALRALSPAERHRFLHGLRRRAEKTGLTQAEWTRLVTRLDLEHEVPHLVPKFDGDYAPCQCPACVAERAKERS